MSLISNVLDVHFGIYFKRTSYTSEDYPLCEEEYRNMYSEHTNKKLDDHWEFYTIFNIFKLAGILQGIMGRVRDGTAASKHAEERGMNVFPLSKGAWSIVESNF